MNGLKLAVAAILAALGGSARQVPAEYHYLWTASADSTQPDFSRR